MKFIIDVETIDKNHIIRRLDRLKTTISVEDNGEYHQDRSYSQIKIDTTWTEEKLEDWLYQGNFDYVGTVKDK